MDSDPFTANATSRMSSDFRSAVSTSPLEHSLHHAGHLERACSASHSSSTSRKPDSNAVFAGSWHGAECGEALSDHSRQWIARAQISFQRRYSPQSTWRQYPRLVLVKAVKVYLFCPREPLVATSSPCLFTGPFWMFVPCLRTSVPLAGCI